MTQPNPVILPYISMLLLAVSLTSSAYCRDHDTASQNMATFLLMHHARLLSLSWKKPRSNCDNIYIYSIRKKIQSTWGKSNYTVCSVYGEHFNNEQKKRAIYLQWLIQGALYFYGATNQGKLSMEHELDAVIEQTSNHWIIVLVSTDATRLRTCKIAFNVCIQPI